MHFARDVGIVDVARDGAELHTVVFAQLRDGLVVRRAHAALKRHDNTPAFRQLSFNRLAERVGEAAAEVPDPDVAARIGNSILSPLPGLWEPQPGGSASPESVPF